MAREIQGSTVSGNFPPMVGIRTAGNFVKGKVLAQGITAAGNPCVTLQLIDLEGTTTASVSKGVYQEVEVNVGDAVQLIGSVKQLKEKLPQLAIGDITTVKFLGKKKLAGGKSINEFSVVVE